MHDRTALHLLLTPAFLCALLLLLLNDHVLKPAFGGVVTGKLSDFAGLFAFTLFFVSLLPKRSSVIALSVTLLFVYWKSPLSEVMITTWNTMGIFAVGRVVDYGDLVS